MRAHAGAVASRRALARAVWADERAVVKVMRRPGGGRREVGDGYRVGRHVWVQTGCAGASSQQHATVGIRAALTYTVRMTMTKVITHTHN